jgi:hypothetical protein
MIIVQEQKGSHWPNKAVVAVTLAVVVTISGCGKSANAPTAPQTPNAAAPAVAPVAQGTPGASPMSPEDQEMMKHSESKGQGAPP